MSFIYSNKSKKVKSAKDSVSGSESHNTFQFKDNRHEATTQLKFQQMANPTVQKKENKTGMPDNLKLGIENLSGMDMSDVKVHYNSSQPAQLQAHAFAQGNQIHIASGQERHLPHEAWHVVQQKQGRVAPTKQLKGKVNINDNQELENEADEMGARAIQMKIRDSRDIENHENHTDIIQKKPLLYSETGNTIQMATHIHHVPGTFTYGPVNKPKTETVGVAMKATLDPHNHIKGSEPTGQSDMMKTLKKGSNLAKHELIRGHLLNHDLGGFGVPQNLFPITDIANHEHSNRVEEPIKGELYNANAFTTKGIFYTVEVLSSLKEKTWRQNGSKFVCRAWEIPNVKTHPNTLGNSLLSITINSYPNAGTQNPNRGSVYANDNVDQSGHNTGRLDDWNHAEFKERVGYASQDANFSWNKVGSTPYSSGGNTITVAPLKVPSTDLSDLFKHKVLKNGLIASTLQHGSSAIQPMYKDLIQRFGKNPDEYLNELSGRCRHFDSLFKTFVNGSEADLSKKGDGREFIHGLNEFYDEMLEAQQRLEESCSKVLMYAGDRVNYDYLNITMERAENTVEDVKQYKHKVLAYFELSRSSFSDDDKGNLYVVYNNAYSEARKHHCVDSDLFAKSYANAMRQTNGNREASEERAFNEVREEYGYLVEDEGNRYEETYNQAYEYAENNNCIDSTLFAKAYMRNTKNRVEHNQAIDNAKGVVRDHYNGQ